MIYEGEDEICFDCAEKAGLRIKTKEEFGEVYFVGWWENDQHLSKPCSACGRFDIVKHTRLDRLVPKDE